MDDTNKHVIVDQLKSKRPQPYTKNYRQIKNAQSDRNNRPRKKGWLVGFPVPSGQTRKHVTLYRLRRNMCMYNNSWNWRHEFEKKKDGVLGKVWSVEREVENGIIKCKPQTKMNIFKNMSFLNI